MDADEISIVIADNHPITLQGLRTTIESEPGFRLVGEAGDGPTALAVIRSTKPQVAILDIGMPGMTGLEVARALRDEEQAVAVIILTIEEGREYFDRALEVGARGYVLKSSVLTEVASAIRAVAAGSHVMSPAMTSHLAGRRACGKSRVDLLTPAERRVLRALAELKTSKEIADELGISFRTVEKHRANISTKLDIHGGLALVKFALANLSDL